MLNKKNEQDLEPLARVQLSFLRETDYSRNQQQQQQQQKDHRATQSAASSEREGRPTPNHGRSIVISLTMSHILGDGFTTGVIWLELLTVLHSEMSKGFSATTQEANVSPSPPPIISLPGHWIYDRKKAGLCSSAGDHPRGFSMQDDGANKLLPLPGSLKIVAMGTKGGSAADAGTSRIEAVAAQADFDSITFSPLDANLGPLASWRKMAASRLRAVSTLLRDARRFGLRSIMHGIPTTTILLHIPRTDLDKLRTMCSELLTMTAKMKSSDVDNDEKGRASPDRVVSLSANSVLSGLLWVLNCSIRGRPLPGQPVEEKISIFKHGSHFGITADLRFNLGPKKIMKQTTPPPHSPRLPSPPVSSAALDDCQQVPDIGPADPASQQQVPNTGPIDPVDPASHQLMIRGTIGKKRGEGGEAKNMPIVYLGNFSCGLHARSISLDQKRRLSSHSTLPGEFHRPLVPSVDILFTFFLLITFSPPCSMEGRKDQRSTD